LQNNKSGNVLRT